MTENEIARQIVDAAYKIHVKFGPGLLESAYEALLAYELRKRGLEVTQQQPIPITYEEVQLSVGYRADLIVEDKVIVELKSVEKAAPVHKKQLLTYLKLADKRLGLLINFGAALIKHGITRVVNGLREDQANKVLIGNLLQALANIRINVVKHQLAKPRKKKKKLGVLAPLREPNGILHMMYNLLAANELITGTS